MWVSALQAAARARREFARPVAARAQPLRKRRRVLDGGLDIREFS
jgi:hypothetical protein